MQIEMIYICARADNFKSSLHLLLIKLSIMMRKYPSLWKVNCIYLTELRTKLECFQTQFKVQIRTYYFDIQLFYKVV